MLQSVCHLVVGVVFVLSFLFLHKCVSVHCTSLMGVTEEQSGCKSSIRPLGNDLVTAAHKTLPTLCSLTRDISMVCYFCIFHFYCECLSSGHVCAYAHLCGVLR